MQTLSERIKERMDELGITQSELARRTGFSTASVAYWVNGKVNKLRAKALLQLSRVLNVNPEWLQNGKGSKEFHGGWIGETIKAISLEEGDELPSGYVAIPEYILTFSAGNGEIAETENPDELPAVYRLDWLNSLGLNEYNARRYKVHGDSMEPTLYDGDTVLVDTSQNDPKRIREGRVYAIRLYDFLLIKRLRRKLDGHIQLVSDNPTYPIEEIDETKAENFAILGKVVERSGRGNL